MGTACARAGTARSAAWHSVRAGPPPHRRRGFILFVLALIVLNWIIVLLSEPSAEPRVTVPFNPYFAQQVQAGKVQSISSTSDTIEGTCKSKQRYPQKDSKATPTKRFATAWARSAPSGARRRAGSTQRRYGSPSMTLLASTRPSASSQRSSTPQIA